MKGYLSVSIASLDTRTTCFVVLSVPVTVTDTRLTRLISLITLGPLTASSTSYQWSTDTVFQKLAYVEGAKQSAIAVLVPVVMRLTIVLSLSLVIDAGLTGFFLA